jgi:hypothetical protein
MSRRRPILLTRKILLEVYRRKKCGGTPLSISAALDMPYSQVLDALNPNVGLKLPGSPQPSRTA